MSLTELQEKDRFMTQKKKIIGLIILFLVLGISLGFNIAFTTRGPEIITRETRVETTPRFDPIEGQEPNLRALYEEISPSVVLIEVRGTAEGSRQGSGFVHDHEGHIITNEHVLRGADEVRVTFPDGEMEIAEVVGKDIYSDIAVLNVDRTDLKPIPRGTMEETSPGDSVVALGNPFGLEGTITRGIVSQKDRLLDTEAGFSIPNVIQTDAAINPGNSGGPLINMHGEVVGINTAIRTGTGTFIGIGFAVSVQTMERVVPSLIDEGEYKHAWIGIQGRTMNPQIAEKMDTDQKTGVLISEVVEGGPADQAGLRGGTYTEQIWEQDTKLGGDIITAINGDEIRSINHLISYIAQNLDPEEEITVTIERDGEEQEVELTLGERPEPGQVG